jgi:hypothetical protein
MELTVIIPTVAGREQHLERCLRSYDRTLGSVSFETIVIHDKPTCSVAWNEGIEQARGNVIHLSADDLEAHDGWYDAALATLARERLPEARILNADGSLHSCGWDATERPDGEITPFTRIPTFPRSLIEIVYPVFQGHYFSDEWVSHQARKVGWETVICRGYLFTHHWAQEGRNDTRERVARDRAAYERAIRKSPPKPNRGVVVSPEEAAARRARLMEAHRR